MRMQEDMQGIVSDNANWQNWPVLIYHSSSSYCYFHYLFLVSQPYSHSNYKEILPIYWMTPV